MPRRSNSRLPPAPKPARGAQARDEPPAEGAVRAQAAAASGAAAAAVAEEPPEGDGLDQRDQVRRLSPAVLARSRQGARGDAQRAGLDRPAARRGARGRRDCGPRQHWWTANWWRSTRRARRAFPPCRRRCRRARMARCIFYLFDLLHLDGWDLRPASCWTASACCPASTTGGGMLRYSDHHVGRRRHHAARGVPHGAGRHHLQAGGRARIAPGAAMAG